jgi:hypothetical protein
MFEPNILVQWAIMSEMDPALLECGTRFHLVIHLCHFSITHLIIYHSTMPGNHENKKSYADPSRPPGIRLSERDRTILLALHLLLNGHHGLPAKNLNLPIGLLV